MPKNWTMREYMKGDEAKILDYQNSMMTPEDRRSSSYWEWEYARNPRGIVIIWIAEDGDTLAGHYARMPLKMKVGTQTLSGAQSVDTFTHHGYRRLGIFAALAERVYHLAGQHGIAVLYGFPSIAAYQGFVKKLGWIRVTSIEKMSMPLDVTSLMLSALAAFRQNGPASLGSLLVGRLRTWRRTKRLLSRFTGVRVEHIREFEKDVDDLWAEISNEVSIRVVKDSEYLNWRYFDKPDNSYSVFQVTCHEKNMGYIVIDSRLS